MATVTVRDRGAFLLALQATALRFGTHIICFNADMMAGVRHVRSAVFNASRSFKEGNQIANTLEMEALLFAAGSRQCSIASTFGIREGTNQLYICCLPPGKEVWTDLASFLELTEHCDDEPMNAQKTARLMTLFEISETELDTVGRDRIIDLVLERVALLNAIR
jgi:KEOPS complex subunit Cgi121